MNPLLHALFNAKTFIFAFAFALVISLFLNPIFRDLALKKGYVDNPNSVRKLHKIPTPRIGGAAIALAFFAPILSLLLLDNRISEALLADPNKYVGLLVGAAGMTLLGLADDFLDLPAKFKFLAQWLIATFAFACGVQIEVIANPFGDPISLGLMSYPVTMFWVVGICNAVNLLDGLDGLAGGVSMFSVLTLFVLSWWFIPNIIVAMVAISLAGAILGFLKYNFHPATIFMGDSGSLFIGYVLAVTAVMGSAKSPTLIALLVPVLALGLPIFDTLMAMIRRFIGGRPVFGADRGHIHHKLIDLGFSTRQAVSLMYGLSVFLGLGALAMVNANSTQSAMILGVFGVGTVVLSHLLGYTHWKTISQSIRYGFLRQQSLKKNILTINEFRYRLASATSLDELNRCLADFGECMDIDAILVEGFISHSNQPDQPLFWSWPMGDIPQTDASTLLPMSTLSYPLKWRFGSFTSVGSVTFAWHADEELVQLPDEPGYALMAILYRDRLLTLSAAARGSGGAAEVAELASAN